MTDTAQEAYELVVAQIERMDAHKCNRAIVPLEVSRSPLWPTVKKWLKFDGYRLATLRGDMLVVLWDA